MRRIFSIHYLLFQRGRDKIVTVDHAFVRGGDTDLPNIKSAIKRVQIIKTRTLRNASARSALKTSIRRFDEVLATGNVDKAKEALVKAVRTLDKAAAKGLIHKNMAARKKSQLMRRFNRTSQPDSPSESKGLA
jgi:small subunit ribosomal protein S20